MVEKLVAIVASNCWVMGRSVYCLFIKQSGLRIFDLLGYLKRVSFLLYISTKLIFPLVKGVISLFFDVG